MTTILTIQCTAGDCWADKNNNFDATGANLYIVDRPTVTNANIRTWIPFTVPYRYLTIESAYITVTADQASAAGTGNIKFSCEAADNPSTPADGADLNGRTLSAFSETISIGDFADEEVRTFQIDNPIQETLDRAGWRSGNTLAVIIDDVDFGDSMHSVYSYEGDAAKRAYLTLYVADTYIPSAGAFL